MQNSLQIRDMKTIVTSFEKLGTIGPGANVHSWKCFQAKVDKSLGVINGVKKYIDNILSL